MNKRTEVGNAQDHHWTTWRTYTNKDTFLRECFATSLPCRYWMIAKTYVTFCSKSLDSE